MLVFILSFFYIILEIYSSRGFSINVEVTQTLLRHCHSKFDTPIYLEEHIKKNKNKSLVIDDNQI